MFFLGLTSATITQQQVLNDIVGVLTGSITTTAGLSASFVSSSSTLISTIAPGWSLYDSTAGAVAFTVQPVVIRSAWSDSASNYKNLFLTSPASGYLSINGYHTWNSGTHTGTLPTGNGVVGTWGTTTITANSYIMVNSSANHILITTFTNNIFTQNNTMGLFEFTRDDPWNTVANGYPSWFIVSDNNGGSSLAYSQIAIPKIYNTSNGTDITPLLGVAGGGPFIVPSTVSFSGNTPPNMCGFSASSTLDFYYTSQGCDATKATTSFAQPFSIRSSSSIPFEGGSTAATQSSVYLFRNMWNGGDTVVVNSTTYFVVKAGSRTLLVAQA